MALIAAARLIFASDFLCAIFFLVTPAGAGESRLTLLQSKPERIQPLRHLTQRGDPRTAPGTRTSVRSPSHAAINAIDEKKIE